MKKLIFLSLMAGLWLQGLGQNDIDALRFSNSNPGFTARSMGSAGAFGALGADISSATINPAGLALYRSNYFVIGLGMGNTKNESTYLNEIASENEFSLNIPNAGFVFNRTKFDGRKPATKGWVNTNFAITMNRTNDFNRIVNFRGENNDNSMLDYFSQRANGLTIDQLGATDEEFNYGYYDVETMVWEAYLINSVASRQYAPAYSGSTFDRPVYQRNTISSSGSMNDISFSLASNYQNKVYLGGGFILTSARYREVNRYTEADLSTDGENWSSWELEQKLTTTGVGVSANLGLIIRAADNVRLGASFRTPTVFSMNDEYNDRLVANLDTLASFSGRTLDGNYDYKVITPLKTTLSAAYLFEKKGFVSVDAEFVDYASMRLRPVNSAFEVANERIQTKYRRSLNLRIGAEYIHDIFRFRAGIANNSSPLRNAVDNNLRQMYFTGGIGIRERNWALDLALASRRGNEIRQAYSLDAETVPYAKNKIVQNSMLITLSTKF